MAVVRVSEAASNERGGGDLDALDAGPMIESGERVIVGAAESSPAQQRGCGEQLIVREGRRLANLSGLRVGPRDTGRVKGWSRPSCSRVGCKMCAIRRADAGNR